MEPHHWMILIGFVSIEVTILTAIIRSRVELERRLGQTMTRSELELINEKRDQKFMQHFERIEEKIDLNENRDAGTRHAIRDTVQHLTTEVALIRQLINTNTATAATVAAANAAAATNAAVQVVASGVERRRAPQ